MSWTPSLSGPLRKLLAITMMIPPAAAATAINFPMRKDNIQLDLVGLLTVIGEAAMELHAQAVTGSHLCLLPRILPAPQAFLRPERPRRLPLNIGVINVGVSSGNEACDLNFVPNLLLKVDSMKRFELRVVSIKPSAHKHSRIAPRMFAPTEMLTLFGAVLTVGLLVFGVRMNDHMAVVAVSLLSLTSVLTGLGRLWKADLQKRTSKRKVPCADVLVKGVQGCFIIVRCDEYMARELFFGPERCAYVLENEMWFRVLAGMGTFTLMAAVVFLANCTWDLQATIGLIYIVLNGIYWVVAVLPGYMVWDLSMYEYSVERKEEMESYTLLLAEVIKITKCIDWSQHRGIVPATDEWKEWLQQVLEDARALDDSEADAPRQWHAETARQWDPEGRLSAILNRETAS